MKFVFPSVIILLFLAISLGSLGIVGIQFWVKTAAAAPIPTVCPVFTSPGGTCIDDSSDSDSGAPDGSSNNGTDGESSTTNGGTTTASGGGNTKPSNTISKGRGWSLKNGTDYSSVACAPGSTDKGVYKHPKNGFKIRKCSTKVGLVSSLISQRTVDMIAAAKAAGVSLSGSGFRSYETQQSLYSSNCSSGGCSPPTARPGNSMHERGLAVDFSSCSKGGKVYNWLKKNGSKYGFYNLPSESWHWSMSGN